MLTIVTQIIGKDGKLDYASCEGATTRQQFIGPQALHVPFVRFGDNGNDINTESEV